MKIHTWQPRAASVRWPWLCLAMFVVCFLISTLVPSFQAPDEFDHVDRAYMLSKGQLALYSMNGSPSGGLVDDGLLKYMRFFEPLKSDGNRKFSIDEERKAADVRWSGKETFVTAVGTSYYFPALYAPQAIGLGIGRLSGLSVGKSYQMARYLELLACFALLIASFRLFSPPSVVLGLLVLPMNLFLLSSAVLDGMATCTAILALSAFMRLISDPDRAAPIRLICVLAVAVALLSACRANLLPLLALPFAVSWLRRDRGALILAIGTAMLVLGWTMYTVKFTTYPPGARNVDHAARLLDYLLHPWQFGRVVFTTLATPSITHFYALSFIGILGWLDAPLPPYAYYATTALLALIVAFSFSVRTWASDRLGRGLLVVCAIASILLTFLALLVQWTIGPATTVDGVQGRYFMIPALILSYALFADRSPRGNIAEIIRSFFTVLLFVLASYVTTRVIIGRYFTPDRQPDPATVPVLTPSAPLTHERPIALHFSAMQITTPMGLDSVSLRFGTYRQSHPGKAALILRTNGGESLRLPFELSDLEDNGYKLFRLDGKPYVSGEIVSDGGQGISSYELRRANEIPLTCVQVRTNQGHVDIARECPAP